MSRCPTPLIHPDKSTAQCVLDRDHMLTDSDHRDEHGHTAKVLVTQAVIRSAEAMARQRDKDNAAASANDLSNDQLQAAFLAARAYGKILDDDVLRAIILAARNA